MDNTMPKQSRDPRGKRYPAKIKFAAVMELLRGEKQPGEIGRIFSVHPGRLNVWKKIFMEKGPSVFDDGTRNDQSQKQLEELQRLLGKKEIEIELLKKYLGHYSSYFK